MTGKRVALIVAVSNYSDPALMQLMAPAQDAKGLAEILENPSIGNFDVKLLINQPSYTIKQEIEGLFGDERSKDDLLLLYFSCHGIKDQNGHLYIATTDTNRKRLRSTSVEAGFVTNMMSACIAQRQVLLLDCCYSGAFAKGFTIKADKQMHTNSHFEVEENSRGRLVITASDSMQYSFEGDSIKKEEDELVYSVLTNALIHGLRTGEADLDGDGRITGDELYEYASKRVKSTRPQQTPRKWGLDMEGQIMIAINPNLKKVTYHTSVNLSHVKQTSNFASENEQLTPITLDDEVWNYLLLQIKSGMCTAFIGERACFPNLPSERNIADQLVNGEQSGYDPGDHYDLAKIAQSLVLKYGEVDLKNKLAYIFKNVKSPDFSRSDEPHSVLSGLDLPLYITTNYDDLMVRCLLYHKKRPIQESLEWNTRPEVIRGKAHNEDKSFEPTKEVPLVYHLCGQTKTPESIVLTESDYENYNESILRLRYDNSMDFLPHSVRLTMTNNASLFIGYTTEDRKFHALLNWINSFMFMGRSNYLKVLTHPFPKTKLDAKEYDLQKYIEKRNFGQVCVYWGSVQDFAHELHERWKKHK